MIGDLGAKSALLVLGASVACVTIEDHVSCDRAGSTLRRQIRMLGRRSNIFQSLACNRRGSNPPTAVWLWTRADQSIIIPLVRAETQNANPSPIVSFSDAGYILIRPTRVSRFWNTYYVHAVVRSNNSNTGRPFHVTSQRPLNSRLLCKSLEAVTERLGGWLCKIECC
jgi:hypothetical protein